MPPRHIPAPESWCPWRRRAPECAGAPAPAKRFVSEKWARSFQRTQHGSLSPSGRGGALRLQDMHHLNSRGFLRAVGANTEQMADREHQVGAVHGVEVEGVDAVLGELLYLAGRDGCRHQLARIGVIVEAVEFFGKPGWHGGAGAGHKAAGLLEIV